MDNVVKLLFEIGSLKLVPRSGWFKVGIKEPETVAEHTFRTAILAFIVAREETSDLDIALKAAFLGLIHDLHESRTLDLHKVAKRYTSVDSQQVLKEQMEALGLEEEVEGMKNLQHYVKDADKLELLLQAKEYSEQHPSAMIYTNNLEFESKAAKKLAERIRESDHRWWLDFEEVHG